MRVVEQQVSGLLAAYESTPVYDPVGVLASLAGDMVRWQQVMHDQVDQLTDLTTTDELGVERAKALVELYERAMQRTGRLLVDIAKLDLEARMVRIGEDLSELVMRCVEQALPLVPLEAREPFRLRLVEAMRAA